MEVVDTIQIDVNGKIRKIELVLGDATKLPLKSKVDLILVSAFCNNYMPTPGTLIRALEQEFGVSVQKLAKHKHEDLRKNFNCWISKDLPKTVPFKRLLCFEQDFARVRKYKFEHDQSVLVADVFRALFTTIHEDDCSLITPILASGNQRADKVRMLNAMIKSASGWMKAGMPLSLMKVVIYKRDLNKPTSSEDVSAINEFIRLKEEISFVSLLTNDVIITTDMLLFYMKGVEEMVYKLLDLLRHVPQTKPKELESKKFCIDEEFDEDSKKEIENFDLYEDMMMECRKVVVFLTNDFLQNVRAMELFNLALCLSMKSKRNILTPICLEKIQNLPEYMSLSQWIDCKVKTTGDTVSDKLKQGAESLYNIVTSSTNGEETQNNVEANTNYDIFISYSHKNSQIANILFSFLSEKLPDNRIFFDKSEIKAGFAWQETLYSAVDSCSVFIALLSEHYFASTICQEEFSLALCQHHSENYSTHLLPIWISETPIEEVITNSKVKSFFFTNKVMCPDITGALSQLTDNDLIATYCGAIYSLYVKNILKGNLKREAFLPKDNCNYEDVAVRARSQFIKHFWNYNAGSVIIERMKNIDESKEMTDKQLSNDVVIVYSFGEVNAANYLKQVIKKINSKIKVSLCEVGGQNELKHMTTLESSYLIVFLLNAYFVTTKKCMLQLQVAISLHRRNNGVHGTRVCSMIMDYIPSKPSYLQLLPNLFCVSDEIFSIIHAKYEYVNSECNLSLNVNVPQKTRIALHFLAHWICQFMFRDNQVVVDKLPVVYSPVDLINTGFNTPDIIQDSTNIHTQVIKISDEKVKVYKEEVKKIVDISNPTENIFDRRMNKKEAKPCYIM